MKPAKPYEEIDSLSLLAHKVAPCVFDLSSYQSNVSIRDQMVRAQQLVIDLKAAHKTAGSLLIVGMGVAGVNAALTACEAGFEDVRIVEVERRPFNLFHGVTSRYVGPYMYEWPSHFHTRQSYPSHFSTPWSGYGRSPLTWDAGAPVNASQLAELLEGSVRDWCGKRVKAKLSVPTFLLNVDKSCIKEFIKCFAEQEAAVAASMAAGIPVDLDFVGMRHFGHSASFWDPSLPRQRIKNFTPDYIIVAAGMGKEQLHIDGMDDAPSPSFWAQDKLKDAAVTNQRVVILGGGDGAIQDSLRALTIHDHPITFIEQLEAVPLVRQALENEIAALLSADRQLRQHNSWSRAPEAYAMIDKACREAAANLAAVNAVSRQVCRSLRQGRGEVFHYVRGEHFDKAYLLNRFVIYLLAACVKPGPKRNDGGMGFKLEFNREVRFAAKAAKWKEAQPVWDLQFGTPNAEPSKDKISTTLNVHHVVVRFGIHPESIPGPQLIQLSEAQVRQRTTLNRVELPFVSMQQPMAAVSKAPAHHAAGRAARPASTAPR